MFEDSWCFSWQFIWSDSQIIRKSLISSFYLNCELLRNTCLFLSGFYLAKLMACSIFSLSIPSTEIISSNSAFTMKWLGLTFLLEILFLLLEDSILMRLRCIYQNLNSKDFPCLDHWTQKRSKNKYRLASPSEGQLLPKQAEGLKS